MAVDSLSGLNPEQQQAVLHFDSPLLIVAGAGSGKTRVITHKIAYLILEKKMQPHHILAVTFTNKAASEMKIRIEALTGIEARLFNISTFHSLGLRILRESGGSLGFDSQWQVMDDDDQRRLFERLVRENFPYLGRDNDDIRRKISLAKMNLNYPNNGEFLRQKGFSEDEISIFAHYHAAQQQNKLWDYEDLISFAVILLRDHETIREKYQQKFHYVLVDEFQDTNPNQYELIKLLCGDRRSITVVGDDDQAIYSWRGASVRFLFDYEQDFPGTRIIKLEQNYRSTPQILSFANRLISQNALRKTKQMWSDSDNGHPVFVLRSRSKEEEAEEIARLIIRLKASNPELFPLAILYRINSQSLSQASQSAHPDIAVCFSQKSAAFAIISRHAFTGAEMMPLVLIQHVHALGCTRPESSQRVLADKINPAGGETFSRIKVFLQLEPALLVVETAEPLTILIAYPNAVIVFFENREGARTQESVGNAQQTPVAILLQEEAAGAGHPQPSLAAAGHGLNFFIQNRPREHKWLHLQAADGTFLRQNPKHTLAAGSDPECSVCTEDKAQNRG